MSRYPHALHPTDEDLRTLLACQTHIGSRNATKAMEPYIFTRRADGVNLINIQKTWEKLVLAARVIVTIENPEDVVIISARPYAQRAALKFASYTGAKALAGRFTPGTFTNYITKGFKEPRLVIVADPRVDAQAIIESSYVNIPVIALCDADSSLDLIDVAIPTNNKGKQAIGCMFWLLAREVLRLRGSLQRTVPWEVMIDMFFYRDPEQAEKDRENRERANEPEEAEGQWDNAWEQAPPTEWTANQQAEWSAAPEAAPVAQNTWA